MFPITLILKPDVEALLYCPIEEERGLELKSVPIHVVNCT